MQALIPSIGEVVYIGKFYMDTHHSGTPEVKLHFLIFKQTAPSGEPGYAGVTLELGLFTWSKDPEGAKQSLVTISEETIVDLHSSKNGRNQYMEELSDGSLEGFWGLYRKLAYLLGDPERKHVNKLKEELDEKKGMLLEKEERISELKVDIELLKRKTQEKINA